MNVGFRAVQIIDNSFICFVHPEKCIDEMPPVGLDFRIDSSIKNVHI